MTAGILVAVAVIVYLVTIADNSKHLDGVQVQETIAGDLSKRLGQHVPVTCPQSIVERSGKIVDCTATVDGEQHNIRVVQDDGEGHFHWILTE